MSASRADIGAAQSLADIELLIELMDLRPQIVLFVMHGTAERDAGD
jgi:hypothetical protein